MAINFKDKAKKLHVNNNGYDLLNFTPGGKYGIKGFTGMISFIPLNNLWEDWRQAGSKTCPRSYN